MRARNDNCTNDNPTWGSTLFRYSMDGVVYGNEICFDHQNHEGAFDATEYFTLEPELEKGVYLINASGYSTDDCSMTQRRQWGSILWLLPGAQAESAVISVWKWFNDDNPQAVTVHVDCDSGTPSADTLSLTNGQTTQFMVSNFESGFLNCTVSEDLPTADRKNKPRLW